MPDGFVTAAEAAEELGISLSRIARLCQQGRIKGAQKFARVWLIPTPVKRIRAPSGPPGRGVTEEAHNA